MFIDSQSIIQKVFFNNSEHIDNSPKVFVADIAHIGYFHTTPVIVIQGQAPELEQLITTLNERVEQFTCRGSGYVLSGIRKLTVVLVPFLPLGGGSSYIPTPEWLAAKKACINVKVYGDRQDCSKFAVLSALFRVKQNSDS